MNLLDVGILEKAREIEEESDDEYTVTFLSSIDGEDEDLIVTYERNYDEFNSVFLVSIDGTIRHEVKIKNKVAFERANQMWLQLKLTMKKLNDMDDLEEQVRIDNLVANIQ